MSPQRSIVVTGGASGIGLGITKHFLNQDNTHVTILDINATTGAQTLSQLRDEFPSASVTFEQCDVSSWESQAAIFEKIYKQQGQIDTVFANAGITEKGSLLPSDVDGEGPMKPELATLNVNLIGCIYTVQLGIYYISKNEVVNGSRGMVVCTASNAGLYPFPMAPLYATTKHGVVGLVRSLARTLEAKRIRINALAPAVVGKSSIHRSLLYYALSYIYSQALLETNIAPSSDLFKSMILTPMSTVMTAVANLMNDPSLSGKVAELHGENVTFAEAPEYVDENTGRNIENFWNLGYA
ncbi:uncharacterized protein N7469_000351 [Penicillium citrinum]|uniref:Short chain dehydrogenase/reductase n=1 Tax=Penicillium citrinum TaxID=5077 RepID=A0A9W9PEX3_PENCI|nr:uncharacterized protein N7469_000351 [Penicillium citrinum]KAJ5242024.1 hypothetical protein N7469_000351 [Penicillium citrinum]